MKTKKDQSRGRPKKDFGELKSKIAETAAENKGKLGRGRPKKIRSLDDSVNTKIFNNHKEISNIEKKSNEIHKDLQNSTFSVKKIDKEIYQQAKNYEKYEECSRKILIFSIILAFVSLIYFLFCKGIFLKDKQGLDLAFTEISGDNQRKNDDLGESNLIIENNSDANNKVEDMDINVIEDENILLIKSFYEKINNKDFDTLNTLTDKYLKNSDAFRTYYSKNWLSNFLAKIDGNRIDINSIKEINSSKTNVKNYSYNQRYSIGGQQFNEEWEIAIIDRNGTKLIGSIMCITTGCSKMPFFQK